MKNAITVLHLGDLHLDSPFSSMSSEAQSRANTELRDVFSRAMRFAAHEKADIVLLAGDLFDREYYSPATVALLVSEMRSLPDCRFVISPGNHDPLTPHSPYKSLSFPPNCHIFDKKEVSVFSFPEINTDVYGYAFQAPEYTGNPLSGFKVSRPERFNLLCAHTELGAVAFSTYAPISNDSLLISGIDYAALGHIHTSESILRAKRADGECFAAYSGCIAGRDYSEHGEKGGILVKLSVCDGKKLIRPQRITFCPWVYRDLTVDVSGARNSDELTERLLSAIPKERQELRLRARVRIRGRVPEDAVNLTFLRNQLSALGDIKLIDETLREESFDQLKNDYTLKGAFYRALSEQLASDDPTVARRARLALKMGLHALEGGNPADAYALFDRDID